MGRKDKFTVDYFLHKCNHGKTIYILENRFGNDGYAVWFKTLELLGATKNHFYDCRNTTDWEFLSAKMQVEPNRLRQIYDLLSSLKTIDPELWSNNIIWSDKFVDGLSEVYSRRSNNCMNKSDLCTRLSIKCTQKSSKVRVGGISDGNNTTTVLNSTILNYTELSISFEKFWNLYDKKVSKKKSINLWNKLTDDERSLIIDYIPKYKKAQTDKSFRKNPDVFLGNKAWEDEIIIKQPANNRVSHRQKRINHYVYKCPSCNKEYHPRVMKGEDDFDAYRCDENPCQKVGLGKGGKNMVGYQLEFIKKIYRENR